MQLQSEDGEIAEESPQSFPKEASALLDKFLLGRSQIVIPLIKNDIVLVQVGVQVSIKLNFVTGNKFSITGSSQRGKPSKSHVT